MLKSSLFVCLLGTVTAAATSSFGQNVSIEEIAIAIEKHIVEQSEESNFFHVEYNGKTLKLQLIRIHMEYLADLGGGIQFACVDLVGTDGPVYDVDFFLSGTPGDLRVTETTVHKVNGQPVYAWEQTDDATWVRVPVKDASPRLLGVIQGEDEFEFVYRVRLPELLGSTKIWLPIAQSDIHQTVEIKKILAPVVWRELDETVYGNKVMFMTAGPSESGKAIEIHYLVHRKEMTPYPVATSTPQLYLQPDHLVPNDSTFRQIAEEVTHDKTTVLMKARALYDHVIDQFRYARYGSGWGVGDAVYACEAKSGNCSDFHSYFIGLARAAGIPARFAIGAAVPSERNEGGIDGYHCWAEFYSDDRWWPVDISEADKNSTLASYFFGHQPANRIELSKGRDLVVDPQPASGPINFLAYPVIEAEGQPVEASTEFQFTRF